MKLAITSQTPELTSPVDLRFGRAAFFLIVETETGQQTVVDNSEGVNAVQGAGTHGAQTLARLGVQAVITGHVGPKAWNALQAAKIRVYSVSTGSTEQAVQDYHAGRLRELTQSDVQGHWS